MVVMFFFKQNTAYEMRISDWSSDVCSSDLSDAEQIPPLLDDLGNARGDLLQGNAERLDLADPRLIRRQLDFRPHRPASGVDGDLRLLDAQQQLHEELRRVRVLRVRNDPRRIFHQQTSYARITERTQFAGRDTQPRP